MALRYTAPYFLWVDGDGVPLAGGYLYFYVTGTNTPLATYSNADLTIPNTNPVQANADGYWGPIYLQPQAYKVVLKDANGVQVWTADPVDGSLETDDSVAIQLQAGNYAVDSGTTNAYQIELDPEPASYAAIIGAPIRILIANANTGACTLEINGLGPKAIVRPGGTNPFKDDLLADGIYTFVCDGTNFVCQELAPLATIGAANWPTISVANGGVARDIATLGASKNTGFGVFAVHFDDGAGNAYGALLTVVQGSGTITQSCIYSAGTPGTTTFTVSGSTVRMARSGGPATVDAIITQISA